MKTKAEAEAAAKRLLSRMKSPGWKIRVWENCGWFFSLQRGTMNLSESTARGEYHVFYSDEPGGVGEPAYYHICGNYFTDPNEAVEFALAEAERFIRGLLKVLNANRTAHGVPKVAMRVIGAASCK